MLLLLVGGGKELIHLERAVAGMVPGSGRRARVAHRLQAVDQAARRRLPGAPASNQPIAQHEVQKLEMQHEVLTITADASWVGELR